MKGGTSISHSRLNGFERGDHVFEDGAILVEQRLLRTTSDAVGFPLRERHVLSRLFKSACDGRAHELDHHYFVRANRGFEVARPRRVLSDSGDLVVGNELFDFLWV